MTKNIDGKVSVIMPAHNEEDHLNYAVRETIRTFNKFNCAYEIIIVDDGSKDTTYQIAQELAASSMHILVKKNVGNYGKGRAIKKGFRYTTGDYIVFLDSDLDLHPAQLEVFFKKMRDEKADVVIGSKRHKKSRIEYPWHRRLISAVYFFLIKILFGLPIHDTQTGLKLFKRQVLKEVFPKVLIKRYAYDLEVLVLAKHYGYHITESPVIVNFNRILGDRIGLRSIIQTWWDTMAIFYRLYILRWYDKN